MDEPLAAKTRTSYIRLSLAQRARDLTLGLKKLYRSRLFYKLFLLQRILGGKLIVGLFGQIAIFLGLITEA
jgi:hypothetical protein